MSGTECLTYLLLAAVRLAAIEYGGTIPSSKHKGTMMLRSQPFGFVMHVIVVIAVFAISTSGCGKPVNKPSSSASGTAAMGEDDKEAAEIAKAMAKLSAEDRALAEAQKICPVSDHKLGTMDAPFKVVVDGQTVFLCCEGCKEDIEKEPAKYLAKLKK